MDFKPILELLERERLAGEEMTATLLQEAVADFATDSGRAMSAIRGLQVSDVLGLAVGALRLLVSAENRSRGLRYIATLVCSGDLMPALLLDDHILTVDVAASLAHQVAAVNPHLDVRLVSIVLANGGNNRGVAKSPAVLRALALVEAISDCSRLAPSLIQLLRHPCGRVRSKAALLLGRANCNPGRVDTLLASPDGRLRANAVESLWGDYRPRTLKILWQATHDDCSRVVINALLGLCKAGDKKAHAALLEQAESPEPVRRSGAAWAMGESLDREFTEAVEKLAQDDHGKVRARAVQSREKLRVPDPVVVPHPPPPPVDAESVQADTPAKPEKHLAYVRIS